MKTLIIGILSMMVASANVRAQKAYTQTIRGQVVDMQSQSAIPGVIVVVTDVSPAIYTLSDSAGNFRLENVPVGMHDISFRMMSYKPLVLRNKKLNAGKEMVLKIEMEEQVTGLKGVVISGYRKDRPLNDMAVVSARSFSVKEADRYAGTWFDPARMAANYAGVMAMGDQRNDIIIRGNSPFGVLWRLDGIDIPNPNHFGSLGTTGGPVSILNNNTLTNSDFFTGAFPAEYGNATSGVFDLNMRHGNNEKREYTTQISMNGFELAAEGPFVEGKSSYLVNYRYSTLQLFDLMGINFGVSGIPQYQDLTFNINMPTINSGNWTLFGVGGLSYIEALDKDRDKNDWTFGHGNLDYRFESNMGVCGLSNLYFFNKKTRLKTVVAISGSQNKSKVDSAFADAPSKPYYGDNSYEIRYALSSVLSKKVDARNSFNTGVYLEFYKPHYEDSVVSRLTGKFIKLSESAGETPALLQAFAQGKHKFSERLQVNGGLHFQYFTLNGSAALEPRLSAKWEFAPKQSLSAGFGLHSRLQPRQVYFQRTYLSEDNYVFTNKDLGFSRSAHYVLSYNLSINSNLRLMSELYYQYLYDIPVESRPSTYSMINYGTTFFIDRIDSLENKGTGRNYGLELTLERFLFKNYYFLFTASLFDSKYVASDGILRNSAFNGNYVFNFLGGYTFKVSKHSNLNLDIKAVYAGNKRYIPVDIAASEKAGEKILDYSRAYVPQYSPYFRLDTRLSYQVNFKNSKNAEFAVDIQNLTNHKNVLLQTYNVETSSMVTDYQLGLFYVFLIIFQF